MGLILIGKHSRHLSISYDQAAALETILGLILDRSIDVAKGDEEECKVRAGALREGFDGLRLVGNDDEQRGYEFLVIQGMALKEVASRYGRFRELHPEPRQDMVRNLDDEWKSLILRFIDFLENCGGILEVQ